MSEPTRGPVAEERTAGRCPNCGAPHDAYQEYCLECGERLPTASTSREVWTREVWTRESPLWPFAALLLLALLAAGGALAAVLWPDDERETRPGVTERPTIVTGPTTATFPTGGTTFEPTTATTYTLPTLQTTTGTTGTTTTGTTTRELIDWPQGRDGYTIVLRSVPTSQGRGPAEDAGRRALDRNLPQVGLLDSSSFPSLRSGYYVAFTGVYSTLVRAQAALPTVRNAGFPLAYVREISSGSGSGPGRRLGGDPGPGAGPRLGGDPGLDGGPWGGRRPGREHRPGVTL